MANRRKFSSAFKSRVALEALKERETLAELSTRFEVSQEMISRWKGAFLKLSAGVFDQKQSLQADEPSVEVLKAAIERYGKPEIVNSDQGSQYTSKDWIGCLQRQGSGD